MQEVRERLGNSLKRVEQESKESKRWNPGAFDCLGFFCENYSESRKFSNTGTIALS